MGRTPAAARAAGVRAPGRAETPPWSLRTTGRFPSSPDPPVPPPTAGGHGAAAGLIEELLFSPQPDTRLFTSMLLGSTPYRSALGTVVAGQLRAPDVLADPDQSHAVFSALRVLGGPVERRLVEQLVTEPRLPSHVPVQAVYALGHIGGQSTDEFWRRAISRHGAAWQRRGTVAAQVLEGLVYALGMARRDGLLSRVREDWHAPAPARAAAAWWLNIPRQIAASARL